MSEVVISGTFADKNRLLSVMDALIEKGIQRSRMSFVQTKGLSGESFHLKLRTKSAQGLRGGFLIGAILGAMVSLLTLQVGFVIGTLQMSGASASALFGAALGGWAGALIGFIAGKRVPLYEASLSKDATKEDSILLGVVVEEDQVETLQLTDFMKRLGAANVALLDRKYATEVGL
ncbi:MAG: hypothetical protein V4692_03530 [Bdellovibrionota bacterium]